MDGLIATFRQYPELSIFLALALGYWIGGLQIGTFSLGSVTGTLLMGVLIGQMHITISANVKATFFLMFLFAVGYGAGPEFFRELKNEGVPQAIFAAVQCVVSLAVGYAVAKALGYDVGQAAGLLAGSQTISGLLGTAADAINKLALPDEEKKRLVDAMPVAYAVTYIFGTAGSAWILSALGPKLVGGNVKGACEEYEAKMARQAHSAELKLVARGQRVSLTEMLLSEESVKAHPNAALHLGGEQTREGRTFGALALAPEVNREVGAGSAVLALVEPRRAGSGVRGDAGFTGRSPKMSDILFVGTGVTIGAFIGALVIKVGEVPLSLSTSGGALISGLVFSWLRSVRPSFGGVPEPILWMMHSVGLNIFMAVVGINSGPRFVTGLREAGLSFFLAGILVTAIPLLIGLLLARYVFRFHPGIALGCVAGARTTGAALGAVQDVVQSKVPALGYTVTYAVGNTLLTIWGIVIVILMT
jgi:AspT/YidE/YbjL antiporter-like protein